MVPSACRHSVIFEASASNRYATFFFSIFDPGTRELRYVNAGHNPPVILRSSDAGAPALTRLDAGGPVVGLLRNLPYEEQTIALAAGDVLIAYTDGISEAMRIDDEEWGEERMIAAARAARDRSAQQILGDMFRAVDEFTGGAPQHDDMTLVVFKVES